MGNRLAPERSQLGLDPTCNPCLELGIGSLFASGYADGRHLERLPFEAEVVSKPFRTADLLARIRKVLGD